MKNYQKAEMIAKNLPTGSYAAGCPTYHNQGGNPSAATEHLENGRYVPYNCRQCECTM